MRGQTNCVGPFTARSEGGIFVFERQHFHLVRLSLSYPLILVLEENLVLDSPTRIFALAAARRYRALRRRAIPILLHVLLYPLRHPHLLESLKNHLQAPNGLSRWVDRCQLISLTTLRLKVIYPLNSHQRGSHLLVNLFVHRCSSQNGKLHIIFSKTVSQKRANSRIYIITITCTLSRLTRRIRLFCIAHLHRSRVSPIHLRTTSISSRNQPQTQVRLLLFSLIARPC
jgi:hypothetical protein